MHLHMSLTAVPIRIELLMSGFVDIWCRLWMLLGCMHEDTLAVAVHN